MNEVLGVVDDGYGGVVVVMTMMRLGCEGGRRGRKVGEIIMGWDDAKVALMDFGLGHGYYG